MDKNVIPSLLNAFQYEKVDFDGKEKLLFSERLPLILYMGCYESTHLPLYWKIPNGGVHCCFLSSERNRIQLLMENFYFSSFINGKVKLLNFFISKKEKDLNTPLVVSYGTDKNRIISDIDLIYEECLGNAALPQDEKRLLLVIVDEPSNIPVFNDWLIQGNRVEKPSEIISTGDPFTCLSDDDPFAPVLSFFSSFENAEINDSDCSLSPSDKLHEMLINGKRFGISFIFGESVSTDIIRLKPYLTECVDIDAVETTDIITRKTIFDRIVPWSESDGCDLKSFLRKESPLFDALCDYEIIDL